MKEIREENIVHEIESETNNTSFYDRDDDDVIPSSPKRKTDNLEIKKMSLESDKIIDKCKKTKLMIFLSNKGKFMTI